MNKLSLLATTCIATIVFPFAAQAQDQDPSGDNAERRTLQTVTVTAQAREQSVNDVPISVSAVDGVKLQESGTARIEDIQFLVPNLTFTETGIGTNLFSRGIGSGINQAFEQSVAVYIDGVHYGRAQQTRQPFLDLERVEMLRGPQSILFGKNAVAGALNISTAKPSDSFEGFVNASYEFENEESIIEGAISGPLTDRVRGRIAARFRDMEGYVDNLTLNRTEPQREDFFVRGTLEADLTDSLTATLKLESGSYDVVGRQIEIQGEQPATAGPFAGLTYAQILTGVFGADASVLNNTPDFQRSSNGDFSNNTQDTALLSLDWDVGGHQLTSTTAFTSFESDELCDCDFTGATIFDAALQEEYEQFSQEFRLISPAEGNYDYILGAYFQTSEQTFSDQIVVPANSVLGPAINASAPGAGTLVLNTQAAREANVDTDVWSVFGQFNWHFNDAWTLQLGGRYTEEEKTGDRTIEIVDLNFDPLPAAQATAPIVYANLFAISSTNLANLGPTGQFFIGALGEHPVSGSRDEGKFSPDVKLLWEPSNDVLLYASWAQGFKSGGFDFRANNRSVFPSLSESFEFEDEQATNYELGGKFTLADGTVQINATAFFTEFEDLQISIFDGTLGFNVGNAASAEIMGVEADGRWAVSDNWELSGSIALTDFEFLDFQNGQCFFGATPNVDIDGDMVPELCDFTGNSNQLVSDLQGTLAANFDYPIFENIDFVGSADLFYTSEYDASSTFDPALVQDAYATLNLRAGLESDAGWSVAVLAKNVTDETILQFGGDTPLAGSSFGVKSNYAFYNPGRTIAIQAGVRF